MYLHHVSALLEGPETALEPVVRRLLPHLRQPIVFIRSETALPLPTMEIGTLILDEVHTLTRHDQARVLDWLNVATTRPQMISTSSQSVFRCVERGLFAEALYYRLNTILLRIDQTNNEPAIHAITRSCIVDPVTPH